MEGQKLAHWPAHSHPHQRGILKTLLCNAKGAGDKLRGNAILHGFFHKAGFPFSKRKKEYKHKNKLHQINNAGEGVQFYATGALD